MIKSGDLVTIIAGKDKGKRGKVLRVFPKTMNAIVEGVNFVVKHARKTRDDQQGGIVHKESPISISNLMLSCPVCKKAVRIKRVILKDGTKQRYCKKCGEQV